MDEKDEAQKRLQGSPLKLGVYQHYKGPTYVLFAESLDERSLEPLVHYYSIEKRSRWTRTRRNFTETVAPSLEYSGASHRFTFVRRASKAELEIALDLSFEVKIGGPQ
jgi:hypothetical protein